MSQVSYFLNWLGHSAFNIVWFDSSKHIAARTFTTVADAVAFVESIKGQAHGVYVNTQEPRTGVLIDKKLSNADMERYTHLFFDVDREKDTTPTDKIEAEAFTHELVKELFGVEPLRFNSGNAFGMLIKCDLPTGKETASRIGRLYDAMTKRLKAAGHNWTVDQACKDVARICGIPGTVNNMKGTGQTRRLLAEPPIVTKVVSNAEFIEIVDRIAPVPTVAPRSSSEPQKRTQTSLSDVDAAEDKLLYALFYQRYPKGVDGMRSALSDAGFEVLADDGEHVFIRSPFQSEYTSQARDTDVSVSQGYHVAVFHSTDRGRFFDGIADLTQRYLPSLWNEYLEKREARNAKRADAQTVAATTDSAAIEVISATKVDPTNLELPPSKFPNLIRDYVSIMRTTSRMVPGSLLLGDAYTLIGSIFGKSLRIDNWGQRYYPNLWSVSLASTNTNKSGALGPASKAINELDAPFITIPGTMQAITDQIGETLPKSKRQELDDYGIAKWIKDVRKRQAQQHIGRLVIADEFTQGLETMIGGWDSRANKRNLQDVIKLSDSNDPIQQNTVGSGIRYASDLCVSYLGYTQSETWLEKFGGDEFKACGLFGRFLPFTPSLVYGEDRREPSETTVLEVFRKAEQYRDAIGVVECFVDCDETPDFIEDSKRTLADTMLGKDFARRFQNDWARLQNKFVTFGLKLSMIDAALTWGEARRGAELSKLDCRPYFRKNLALATMAYFAYLSSASPISEFGALRTRVLQRIRELGTATKSQLNRTITFKPFNVADMILDDLVANGEIKVIAEKGRSRTYAPANW